MATESKMYCVIMAGGIGSRFWPISRVAKPKQFLDVLGTGKSFLRHTFERFKGIIPIENFLVVTNTRYRSLVLEQIPEISRKQVLCEPIGRNTAPCITYAAFKIRKTDPNAIMVVTPADHLVMDNKEFRRVIKQSAAFASTNNAMMTIGIEPSRPETGYGYIQVDAKQGEPGNINRVKTFTEKPNAEMAEVFLRSGEFLWNSGIFIWKAQRILDDVALHLPDTYQLFESIEQSYNTPSEQKAIDGVYSESRSISIDIGIMERAENVYVASSNFGWSDIGTWGSIYQNSPKDDELNAATDEALLYNTKRCIVRIPKGKVAVIDGLSDYIVVDTDDVLMICPMEQEQRIKTFLDAVKYKKGNKHI